MVLYQVFYHVSFLVTALIHIWFNNLINTLIMLVVTCLSNPRQPIFQSILRLHSVVLVCFVLAFCFDTVSAQPQQTALKGGYQVLNFDEIDTPDGFGNITNPYKGFVFTDFYAFKPSHSSFDGIISSYDLNCAVSKPNALYGAANDDLWNSKQDYEATQRERPSIYPHNPSETFTVHALKIKPLNMPVGFVTINLRGLRSHNPGDIMSWSVDFPAGFHDVLDVQVETFTGKTWMGLTRLEIWADFHFDNIKMEDWEFCLDDIELELGLDAQTSGDLVGQTVFSSGMQLQV
ncbi:uncharacterized protein PV07_12429 [Cladophialophora immunda]|uniref:Uncharacterized protein n=1 Tax=Cladophialophora immunda TaxID=569365 RepID=A0A0D2ACL7_9EURO|nr:uncharacterized protein PV07_12429 [Cladophialophora immunda]KIW22552.1 hypothetical protein PV07_12429 [Cladophialophora immunda]OQV10125.1 hypothetical protein CLAIMM_14168 [Cladophialophora immunda]